MLTFFKLLITYVSIDAIWLLLMTNSFYLVQLDGVIRPDPIMWVGALAWVALSYGSNVLVQPTNDPAKNGFALGFTAYALYNFTNYATIPGWTWPVVIVDSLWGGVLSAVVNYLVKLYQ
jgi:uncharacterized membrane protein